MTEQTLTRNESADLFKFIWSTIVEKAPGSTQEIEQVGSVQYVDAHPCIATMHIDHYEALIYALGSPLVRDTIDKLARNARAVIGETAAPWRDSPEEEEGEPEYALAGVECCAA